MHETHRQTTGQDAGQQSPHQLFSSPSDHLRIPLHDLDEFDLVAGAAPRGAASAGGEPYALAALLEEGLAHRFDVPDEHLL